MLLYFGFYLRYYKMDKENKRQLKKSLQNFIDGMTKEEFEKTLKDAGYDFYKKIKTPVFSKKDDTP